MLFLGLGLIGLSVFYSEVHHNDDDDDDDDNI